MTRVITQVEDLRSLETDQRPWPVVLDKDGDVWQWCPFDNAGWFMRGETNSRRAAVPSAMLIDYRPLAVLFPTPAQVGISQADGFLLRGLLAAALSVHHGQDREVLENLLNKFRDAMDGDT